MNQPQQNGSPAANSSPSGARSEQELDQIQLRIARRADELSRTNGSGRDKDLAHWLQAEDELLGAGA